MDELKVLEVDAEGKEGRVRGYGIQRPQDESEKLTRQRRAEKYLNLRRAANLRSVAPPDTRTAGCRWTPTACNNSNLGGGCRGTLDRGLNVVRHLLSDERQI